MHSELRRMTLCGQNGRLHPLNLLLHLYALWHLTFDLGIAFNLDFREGSARETLHLACVVNSVSIGSFGDLWLYKYHKQTHKTVT